MRLLFCLFLLHLTYAVVAQADKSVTLTVVGQGANAEEARKVALRSSLEQAFGAFVSSKTEVLNDQVSSDEIVTISNGNVQHYEVISESALPDGSFATTIRSTVSVSKLTTFCESKGIAAEFKGSLFAANIQQKNLNSESELKAVQNLCTVLKSVLSKSFDFSVEISEPTQSNASKGVPVGSESYDVPVKISASSNKNMKQFVDILITTLSEISMKPSEVVDYRQIRRPHYRLFLGDMSRFHSDMGYRIGLSKNLFRYGEQTGGGIVTDKDELLLMNPEPGKKFWIGYTLIHKAIFQPNNFRGTVDEAKCRFDTLLYSTTDIQADFKKIKKMLEEEVVNLRAGIPKVVWNKLQCLEPYRSKNGPPNRIVETVNDSPVNWTFVPVVFWTYGDFSPPIFCLRNAQSLALVENLFGNYLPQILLDFSVINDVRSLNWGTYLSLGQAKNSGATSPDNTGKMKFSFSSNNFYLDDTEFLYQSFKGNISVIDRRPPGRVNVTKLFTEKLIIEKLRERGLNPNGNSEGIYWRYIRKWNPPLPESLLLWSMMYPDLKKYQDGFEYYDFWVLMDRLIDPGALFTIKYTDQYPLDDLKRVTQYVIKKHDSAKK